MPDHESDPADWPETLATVLTCTYQTRAGRALAFGLPSSKHFHITYIYWADNQLHTADLFAAKPIPQGTLFPVRYNPGEPRRSQHADASAEVPTVSLLTIGIAGSVVVSTAWLLFLHSCH